MWLEALRRVCIVLYSWPGTGLPRVGEAFRRYIARQARCGKVSRERWVANFCNNQLFCCDLTEHMGSQIFFRGHYSGDQLAVLRRILRPTSVFIDIGANQGEFTVCAAGLVTDGFVHAFEPVPFLRQRLDRNVSANGFLNVKIHPFGAFNEYCDDVPIYGADAVFVDGTANSGLPTIYAIEGRRAPLARIALRKLDDVLLPETRIDVMKIDVEGAELFVLKGAEKIILRDRPYIIFEANAETCRAAGYSVSDICAWLKDRGYQLASIGSSGKLLPVLENKIEMGNIFCWSRQMTG